MKAVQIGPRADNAQAHPGARPMAEAVRHDKTARQLRLLSDALDTRPAGPGAAPGQHPVAGRARQPARVAAAGQAQHRLGPGRSRGRRRGAGARRRGRAREPAGRDGPGRDRRRGRRPRHRRPRRPDRGPARHGHRRSAQVDGPREPRAPRAGAVVSGGQRRPPDESRTSSRCAPTSPWTWCCATCACAAKCRTTPTTCSWSAAGTSTWAASPPTPC